MTNETPYKPQTVTLPTATPLSFAAWKAANPAHPVVKNANKFKVMRKWAKAQATVLKRDAKRLLGRKLTPEELKTLAERARAEASTISPLGSVRKEVKNP